MVSFRGVCESWEFGRFPVELPAVNNNASNGRAVPTNPFGSTVN